MCKKSESIKEIAIALAKFNMKVKRIEDDSENPHFKNTFASLDGIMDEIRPLLAEEGLSVLQMPSGDGDNLKLTNLLVHTSGEWIESDSIAMRPSKSDPQGVGSAITYARRYGISSFLGLSTGEKDDDGNAASHAPKSSQSAPKSQGYQPSNKPAESPTSQSSAPSNVINEKQVTLVKTRMNAKKIPSDWMSDTINKRFQTSSVKNLTNPQLQELLKLMEAYIPVPVPDDDLPF